MRATWPGARSGRIMMVTGPLEVSRSNVLSRSVSGCWVMGDFGFLFLAGFNNRDHERAPRNGVAKFPGDGQRGAAVEHVHDRPLIYRSDFVGNPGRAEGEPRLNQ